MGQDLQYLYRLAGQFVGSQKVKENLNRLPRYADRRFGSKHFAERYCSNVYRKLHGWKPETLGKIIALGVPEQQKEGELVKAGPRALQPVGHVPRTPFLEMKPEGASFFFPDKSGFGLLTKLATQVILAAMLDIAEREAASRDAAKGVHVLDLTAQELKTWVEGEMGLQDLEPIVNGMTSQGQTEEACKAAWKAVSFRAQHYSVGGRTHMKSTSDFVRVVEFTSLELWREEY